MGTKGSTWNTHLLYLMLPYHFEINCFIIIYYEERAPYIPECAFKVRQSVRHVFGCVMFLRAPCFCVCHIQVISIFGIG